MWRRLWRWLTLADVPMVSAWRLHPQDECFFCPDVATCQVTVGNQTWRTCLKHMNTPLETLRGSP